MARPRKGADPTGLHLPIKVHRIDSALLAYRCYSDDVKRLTDSILSDILGASLPQIAKTIDAYKNELDSRVLGDEPEPETGQDEPGEPEPADIPEPAESLA
jgi:hypothetical protein